MPMFPMIDPKIEITAPIKFELICQRDLLLSCVLETGEKEEHGLVTQSNQPFTIDASKRGKEKVLLKSQN